MKQRNQIRTLGEVRKICTVQRMDVEMQVERANAQLRSLDDQRKAEGKALQGFQDGWRSAVSGRSFQLAAAAAWSAEILRTEAVIDELGHDIENAQAVRRDLCNAQTAATARCDATDDLWLTARRMAQRQRDEAVLDAHVGRAVAGWRSV